MNINNFSSIPSQKLEEYTKIDRYKYNPKYCLGQGSYGKVYIALDMITNQQVALKQMDIRNFKNDEYLKNQLVSEVQIMKRLNHRNIVKFMDYFQSNKSYYFITEYCQDGDLREYIINKKQTEDQALSILYQLIEGFKELFKIGVIHRDLKPANILIDKGVFKLCDFGFAKIVDNFNNEMLQTIVGSPLYMSIQVLTGKPYTTKCDIWSLGIILYEMIIGDAPWKGVNEKDLLNNISKQKNIIKDKKFGVIVDKLLNHMLAYEEKNRISWEELFELVDKIKLNKEGIIDSPGLLKGMVGDKKKTAIFSPNKNQDNVTISDNLKAEINRFIGQINELRGFISFLHFISIEMFTNYNILKEMLNNKGNSNFSFEKFLVLLAQFIRHNSKEIIRSFGEKQMKNPELNKNLIGFDKFFKIVKKESFYHEKIYEEIMNLYLKNGLLIELKKDKDLGNAIYGDYTEKEKEKFQKSLIFYGMSYIKEISQILYKKKYERSHLVLIDYIIDILMSFLKNPKNYELNYNDLLKEKGELEDCNFYGEKVLMKYQKLLTLY